MWRYIVGGMSALLLVAAGIILYTGHARSDAGLPAQPLAANAVGGVDPPIPEALPEATEATREQKRFGRYDKNHDGTITREEYLAPRRKAFAKLDTNHDGVLSFDEWSAKTAAKFAAADRDRSNSLTAAEFKTTAAKRKPKRQRQDCPPAAAPADG